MVIGDPVRAMPTKARRARRFRFRSDSGASVAMTMITEPSAVSDAISSFR